MLTLGVAGWIVVVLCLAAIVAAGLRGARTDGRVQRDSVVGYVLAGRTLTAPVFAATLVATWYGGVLASGEFIVRHGIMFVLCLGVPYYIAALLYALLLSKRIRNTEALSIPENIRRVFGDKAALAAAAAILVIAIPAPYMLSIGVLLNALTNLPLWLCVIIGSSISLLIVSKGGLRSDVAANIVQVVLMFGGFALLSIACIFTFGGATQLVQALPQQSVEVPGSVGWLGVAAWLLIAFQTFVDPTFHMRTAATASPREARNGLLLSVAGWVLFDIMQVTIGLYGLAFIPDTIPQWHFLIVAEQVLPDVFKGIVVTAVFAAVMSALDGYALASATTIGFDILGRWNLFRDKAKALYVGLLIGGVIGCVAAIAVPSIVDLIFMAASIAVPGLFLPLLTSVWRPLQSLLRSEHGLPSWIFILFPCVLAACVTLINLNIQYVAQPMLVGLAASALLLPLTTKTYATGQ